MSSLANTITSSNDSPATDADITTFVRNAVDRQAALSTTSWAALYSSHCSSLPGGSPKYLFQPAGGPFLDVDMDAPDFRSAHHGFVVLSANLDVNSQLISENAFLTNVPSGLVYPSSVIPGSKLLGNIQENALQTTYDTDPLTAMDVDEPSVYSEAGVNSLGLMHRVFLYMTSAYILEGEHGSLRPLYQSKTWDVISCLDTITKVAKSMNLDNHIYTILDDRRIVNLDELSPGHICCAFFAFLEVSMSVCPQSTCHWITAALDPLARAGFWACTNSDALMREASIEQKRAQPTLFGTDIPELARISKCRILETPISTCSQNPRLVAWEHEARAQTHVTIPITVTAPAEPASLAAITQYPSSSDLLTSEQSTPQNLSNLPFPLTPSHSLDDIHSTLGAPTSHRTSQVLEISPTPLGKPLQNVVNTQHPSPFSFGKLNITPIPAIQQKNRPMVRKRNTMPIRSIFDKENTMLQY
ncbi:hypothetical protein ONZ45_g2564 [Pleurotus djamor]|nr:hypothetical protein ONZ45_g2564 [Pleurotus djamor]